MDMNSLPHRRGVLTGLAAAPIGASIASASAHVDAASRLPDLIEDYRRAAAAHLAAIHAEEEVDRCRSGELLTIALRQGSIHVEPDIVSRAVVEKQVRDSYRGARLFAADAHRVLRDDNVFGLQAAALDAAEAADLASVAAAYETWPAGRAIAEAAERTARASDAGDAAMLAICSHRCRTMEEARQKAAYLLEGGAWTEEEPLQEHVIALLSSFLPEGSANV